MKQKAKNDPCADGCPRGCAHDRNTKPFPDLEKHGPAMLAALKQVSFYSRINHASPSDYGDLVNGVLKKMGVPTGVLVLLVGLSGCAGAAPPPLTKAVARQEWKRISCHLDSGAHLAPCLSDDSVCCLVVKTGDFR